MAFDIAAAREGSANRLSVYFDDTTFSDVTIKCGDREWPCHKIILSQQSEWFRKALTGEFVEASLATIELHEDSPDVLHSLLEYCYKHDYRDYLDLDTPASAVFHVRVFAIAEKYLITELQHLARAELCSLFIALPPTSLDGLTCAIIEAYNTTSDPKTLLRRDIVAYMVTHADELFGGENGDFEDVLLEVPELAADITKALVKARLQACSSKAGCTCRGGRSGH